MSTPPLVSPTPLRTPMVDLRTGLITREWAPFFQSVITLAGAVVNVTNETVDIGASLMFDETPVNFSPNVDAASQIDSSPQQRDYSQMIQDTILWASPSGAQQVADQVPSYEPPNTGWVDGLSDLQVQQAFAGDAPLPSPVQSAAPATATDYGEPGMIAYDTGFIYVCTAPNTWVRAALTTF